ncbi:hypothetical protein M407DRAFT_27852 [Tulasnella calospora MUT 4182]|uniref:Uncharacterized protein n=1 Tax=Tulasnella calospora MUT 4182 TaxID=1051891 RepID=A0A0C3Q2I0_9AGAM|nr:hypothetical protein M407DRAFT_27852 [Tulasnella calospora MUT 4182]
MQICKDKPDNLSSLDALGIEKGAGKNSVLSFGSIGRTQRNRMGSMGQPPGNRSASRSIGLGLSGFPGGVSDINAVPPSPRKQKNRSAPTRVAQTVGPRGN